MDAVRQARLREDRCVGVGVETSDAHGERSVSVRDTQAGYHQSFPYPPHHVEL